MRHFIYEIVRPGTKDHKIGKAYDICISVIVFVSLVPMMFKGTEPWQKTIDIVTAQLILFDYLLRWITWDIRCGQEGKALPFVKYFFSPVALVTFISLLPSFGILNQTWRMLRILRILTLFGYSTHFEKIINVFRKQKDNLGVVLVIALMYIFASALIMFSFEQDTFKDFFQAVYWSTTALTTVGYGDIAPVTNLGKLISMISSLFGIAIIALPAGIITSGFMEELNEEKNADAAAKEAKEKAPKGENNSFITPELRSQLLRHLLIMASCVALNMALLAVCKHYSLPMWLDTAGTIFASVLIEPCAGVIVAFFTNCFETFNTFDGAILFFMTSAVAAVTPGLMLRTKKGEIRRKMFLPTMVLTTALTSVAATIQNILLTHGKLSNVWEIRIAEMLKGLNLPNYYSIFFPILIVKIIDMTIIFIILWAITKSEPLMSLIHGEKEH